MLGKSGIIYTSRTVHIETINPSLDLMMRIELDKNTVHQYAEAMQAGSAFPPLECAELDGELLLYDGFLRHQSYKRSNITDILVRIRVANNRDDVVLWAVQANAHSGLKRTNADKQRSIEALLNTSTYQNMTNVEVANAAGVVESTVFRYRETLREKIKFNKFYPPSQKASTRVDKAGRTRPRTYNKPKPKSDTPRPEKKSLYQAMASVHGSKINWPKVDQQPGQPAQGYVHLIAPDVKLQQENVMAMREIIGLVRDVGQACKPLVRILPKLSVDDLVATLKGMDSQRYLRKLNENRAELEQMIAYVRDLLERTK